MKNMKYYLSKVILLLRKHIGIVGVLILTTYLMRFLADNIVSYDTSSLFENAVNIYEKGDTGFQYRNILYAYILSIPLFLKIDVTNFGLLFSLFSILFSLVVLYKINRFYSNNFIASFTGLCFVFSFSIMRFATQINSDIPALMLMLLTIYFSWLVLERGKINKIPLVYLFASASISLRYGCIFFFPAIFYLIWVTKRYYKKHLIGLLLCVIPYFPQMIYNIKYLKNFYSISYMEVQPVLGIKFFFKELELGIEFQILHYIKDMFFNFKGMLILFFPFVIVGVYYSFKMMRTFALYLVIFYTSFIFLLSFFAAFSTRYFMGALLPCFLWLNIGFIKVYEKVSDLRRGKLFFYIYIVLALYINFEISFHIVQSSRAIHKVRYELLKKLNSTIKSKEIVLGELDLSTYDPRIRNLSFQNREVIYINSKNILDMLKEIKDKYPFLYCIYPLKRWRSEGMNTNIFRDSLFSYISLYYDVSLIDSLNSLPVIEFLFYKFLRNLRMEIPEERWLFLKLVKR